MWRQLFLQFKCGVPSPKKLNPMNQSAVAARKFPHTCGNKTHLTCSNSARKLAVRNPTNTSEYHLNGIRHSNNNVVLQHITGVKVKGENHMSGDGVELKRLDSKATFCKISSLCNLRLAKSRPLVVIGAGQTLGRLGYLDFLNWNNNVCVRLLRRYSAGSKMCDQDTRRGGMLNKTTEGEIHGKITGWERLNNKRFNKGLSFNLKERQLLGIHGLLPPVVKSIDDQVKHAHMLIDRLENDLDKFIYINGLAERNEHLFYKLLASNISKLMPLVYTPTVGLACQKYSLIYQIPRGMFITIKDKGNIYNVLQNWPERDVKAIVVTDGERILGLGDLGANGMGIPVGKLSLYTTLAGVPPYQTLPITLDVGTNNKTLLEDPLYIGLRQTRVTGKVYDEFIQEFLDAVVERFGRTCLIQFEDFGNANAFRLLCAHRDKYCTFNDDIQGTASVALAGILSAVKRKRSTISENVILFQGAGEAALGIAQLCVMAMEEEGLTRENALKKIWLVDSKGLIIKNRPKGGLTSIKEVFAQDHPPIDSLQEIVETLKPNILIGASTIAGAFTPKIIQLMGEFNEIPVIFALSNPTSKAECTAEQAYTITDGRCIFASGSPFPPVTYKNKTYFPGQGNNSYIFPGIALAVIAGGITRIPEEIFLLAAERLSELTTEEEQARGLIYPPLRRAPEVSLEIANRILEYAYETNLATVKPEPCDKMAYLKKQMYAFDYPPALPATYEWNNSN